MWNIKSNSLNLANSISRLNNRMAGSRVLERRRRDEGLAGGLFSVSHLYNVSIRKTDLARNLKVLRHSNFLYLCIISSDGALHNAF